LIVSHIHIYRYIEYLALKTENRNNSGKAPGEEPTKNQVLRFEMHTEGAKSARSKGKKPEEVS
jgi:hypothetical protein